MLSKLRASIVLLALVPAAACSSSNGGDGAPRDGGASDGSSTTGPVSPDAVIPTDSIWRSTSEWYRPIDGAPTAEHSSEMIGALARWGTSGVFQIDFGFSILDGQGATPVTFPAEEEADEVPIPIPSRGYVEGDYAYDACPDGEDCHVLVVDRGANKLFEVYQAHKSGSAWTGFVALWQLDKTYPRQNRGQGCTSADAAGLPIAPGLIGYRETKNGSIDHALRFIVRNQYIRGVVGDRNVPNVAYPASHGTTAGAAATGVPYGGRLRLKISESDPRVQSPGAKAVVRALRQYGMILADGGNIPLTAESVRVHADADPTATWEGLLGPRDLGFIQPSDFEVVAIPKDRPGGTPGWYATRAEYEGDLKKPLGCAGIAQP
jgi:serine/threonine-protein kinase